MLDFNKYNIQINVPLAEHCTFKVGGPAKYLASINDSDSLRQLLNEAAQESLPVFVLGGGSNLLFSDQGFDGLVIKSEFKDLKIQGLDKIRCGAGVGLSQLVAFSVKHNLTDLEWAMGIPGTVGGAIRGNAGAFGSDIAHNLATVKVFKLRDNYWQEVDLVAAECHFAYRDSIFKHNQDIIIESIFALKLTESKTQKDLVAPNMASKKQSQPLAYPSSGCIFKNIYFQQQPQAKEMAENITALPPQFLDKGLIPAGWLIEQCGLKGFGLNGAAVSDKHANFIINKSRSAKAQDILDLIDLIKNKVKQKFDLDLEEEIQIVRHKK